MQSLVETILCNSIVAEDGVVGMDRRITNFADVRIAVSVRAGMSPDTKKRRILWTVVSLYQLLFQQLMLLEYQMELNFASGLLSRECWLEENVVEMNGIFAV